MNLDMKEILTIRKSFWQRLGEAVKGWIEDDMDNGILQNGVFHYLNKQYIKYKSNHMNKFGKGEKRAGSGKKLKAVKGQSVVSNRVSSVDMKLTGRTIKGLHVASTTEDSVTMSYSAKDSKKIEGNEEKYNRVIAGLNEKNTNKALEEYSKEIDKNLLAWAKKDIKIYIGRK